MTNIKSHRGVVRAFLDIVSNCISEQRGFCGIGNLAICAGFEKIGLYAGIQAAEDIEWGRRARAAGFSVTFPEMTVFFPAHRLLSEL
jgi:hypothetical protein